MEKQGTGRLPGRQPAGEEEDLRDSRGMGRNEAQRPRGRRPSAARRPDRLFDIACIDQWPGTSLLTSHGGGNDENDPRVIDFAVGAAVRDIGAGQPGTTPAPIQKICQVIKPVGSRLTTKKICATRADWEDKKRQDREVTERAQTQLCVVNPSTGKC